MANFRYSHLFTTKVGSAAIQAAATKLNAAEIALAITDGEEKILFKNANGDVASVATEEQINQSIANEAARALSAETDLQDAIDVLESGSTELNEKIETEKQRALSAETELLDIIEGEVSARKAGAVSSVDYDESSHTIDFYNANNEKIDSIDATAFIKDGMIESVELVELSGDTYLRITWNTDAGVEVTDLNIGDIFNADNYYTKAEVDAFLGTGFSVSSITEVIEENERITSTALNDLNSRVSGLTDAIDAEETARDNADVKSAAIDANGGLTLTLGDNSTIVATEAEEITLSAGEF